MKTYDQLSPSELSAAYGSLCSLYHSYQSSGLQLNMARGKPGPEQLELSRPLLDVLDSSADCMTADHVDCRNYGELPGIREARALFADYMEVAADEIIVTGSSSLTFMYDCMARAMLTGVLGSEKPWNQCGKVKFLCPVPGYDRHFSICEFLNIEMIPVPMNSAGVDMDMVESLVGNDEQIKGIWCVPKYSNPSGITYSDDTIRRLAALTPKAPDFRIFYDNAYAMHHVYREHHLLNLLDECQKAGRPDMVYMFGSTNKITFPGAGVAFFAASKDNIAFTLKQLSHQAISWDKLNMLRHVRFFKDVPGIKAHMDKHAKLLKPRFDIVIETLARELTPLGIGTFTKPDGGYFIAYQAPKGCASRIAARCRDAGLILTAAGSTHPYMQDPDDSFIRIASSYPSLKELQTGMDLFCICAKMAVLECLYSVKKEEL